MVWLVEIPEKKYDLEATIIKRINNYRGGTNGINKMSRMRKSNFIYRSILPFMWASD